MTILILTLGSAGDVHPFVGLALALRRRGHRVRMIVNPFYQDLLDSVGIELVPLGTADDFVKIRDNPDLWHWRKGFPTIVDAVARSLRPTYDTLMANYVPGETVVVASSLCLGARVAQDKYNLPMATVHLSPSQFRSTIEPPKLPGLFMPDWLPRWGKEMLFTVGDNLVVDRLMGPPLNRFRAEVGLAPVRGIIKSWWHSPLCVIGLFPDWFAQPQPDWPSQARVTGFPLYDERGVSDMTPELAEFLAAGEPPIVFTPGSAMFHAHDFFRESATACARLNRRGILLSRHTGHIPPRLPAGVRHFAYAPFSQLLPKAAAFVHHGGIGSSAQAMASGVRQVVMPFCHDQLDNAERMKRLNVARVIPPRQYRAAKVEKVLREMLSDDAMTAHCREVARKFVGVDPISETCGLIESLAIRRDAVAV